MTRCRYLGSNIVPKGLATLLCLALMLPACTREVIQIREPYHEKIRIGDGVKIMTTKGTLYSGRVVYVDRSAVVIRTPRQTISDHPVKKARFGTTIPWQEVRTVKVAGTLDSQRKLISNEEIRVNRRTNIARKWLVNIGLLSIATSFSIAVRVQDDVSPASTDLTRHSQGKARLAFWSTWIGGSLTGAILGYRLGSHLDRKRSIRRIERQRADMREAAADTLARAGLPSADLLSPPKP